MKVIKYNKRCIKYVVILIVFLLCGTVYCVQKNKTASDTEKDDMIDMESLSTLSDNSSENVQVTDSDNIYVYVCGSVCNSGVYIVHEGARVYELIEQAGGFTEEADSTCINLVDKVIDGQKIYIPSKEDKLEEQTEADSVVEKSGNVKSGLVNINTADKELLMTLPGIGESKAADIIKYRSNQIFKKTEDIMNISGIKESAYNKIKDYICVS